MPEQYPTITVFPRHVKVAHMECQATLGDWHALQYRTRRIKRAVNVGFGVRSADVIAL